MTLELHKAAEQGNVTAQLTLGLRYAKGEGVPQDYEEAVEWYRKAAEQGVADAQLNLGVMYGNGQGVTQDDKEAAPLTVSKMALRTAQKGRDAGNKFLGCSKYIYYN